MSVSVLIIDDEPDVVDLFRQRFRREARQGAYVLHFASSAAEALERLASDIEPKLIVILSDINMPGMDGLALLREVRRRWPGLPVIMATAYGDDEQRRRAAELGAADFLTKPIDFDFLKNACASCMSRRSERELVDWSPIDSGGVTRALQRRPQARPTDVGIIATGPAQS